MEWLQVALAGIGGVILTKLFDYVTSKEKRKIDLLDRFSQEIARLDEKIGRLEILTSALEDEIIFLGGDPMRVKIRLAQNVLKNHGN